MYYIFAFFTIFSITFIVVGSIFKNPVFSLRTILNVVGISFITSRHCSISESLLSSIVDNYFSLTKLRPIHAVVSLL